MEPFGDVAVDVQSDPNCRVPKPLLHHLRMHASRQCQRRSRVPQVVQADRRKGRLRGLLGKGPGEALRVQGAAVRTADHEVRSAKPAPMSSRSARCRLRCSRSAVTAPGSSATVRRPLAVFGEPIRTSWLTAITVWTMEAARRRGRGRTSAGRAPRLAARPWSPVRRTLPRAGAPGVVEERPHLGRRPRPHLGRRPRPHHRAGSCGRAWRVGRVSRVAQQSARAHGVSQRPVQDRVHVPDGPRREAAASV